MPTIHVEPETHRKIWYLKLDLKKKSLDAVLWTLIDSYYQKFPALVKERKQ